MVLRMLVVHVTQIAREMVPVRLAAMGTSVPSLKRATMATPMPAALAMRIVPVMVPVPPVVMAKPVLN